jgi:hypothetical protein
MYYGPSAGAALRSLSSQWPGTDPCFPLFCSTTPSNVKSAPCWPAAPLAARPPSTSAAPTTITIAARRDPPFAERLRQAEVESRLRHLRAINRAARRSWRAAAWSLEQFDPEVFRPTRRTPRAIALAAAGGKNRPVGVPASAGPKIPPSPASLGLECSSAGSQRSAGGRPPRATWPNCLPAVSHQASPASRVAAARPGQCAAAAALQRCPSASPPRMRSPPAPSR